MRENNPRRNSGDRRDRRFDNRREPRAAAPAPVEEEDEGRLEGRNAITEALRAGRTIDKVFIAQAAAHEYATIDDILAEAEARGQAPLIVICDELSDPHNLGAIMRSAECAGAHGVIIPKRRSVGLTATVAKASAGAVEYMKVARVTNINNAIAELKEKGVWVFGTAAEGSIPMYKADLTGPTAIVIGNEGDGVSQLVRKNCDVMVHIPMKGSISSLNASAAASILLYEAVRQRLG